jgi:hypothetical protein
MKLCIEWSRPIPLRDARSENLIYTLDLEKLHREPGIYIFGRRYGKQFEALYVGKAGRVRSRIRTQFNNLRLMQHLHNAKSGKRVVIIGKLLTKPGQRLGRSLVLIERALIRYFLSEGHDLVNKMGTRIRRHEIESIGHPKRYFSTMIYLERGRRE